MTIKVIYSLFWPRSQASCQPRSPKVRGRRWPRMGGPACSSAGKWKCPNFKGRLAANPQSWEQGGSLGAPPQRSPSAYQHNKAARLQICPGFDWGVGRAFHEAGRRPAAFELGTGCGLFCHPRMFICVRLGRDFHFPTASPRGSLKTPFSAWVQEFSAAAKLGAGFGAGKIQRSRERSWGREGADCLNWGRKKSNEAHRAWRESCFAPFSAQRREERIA